MKTKNPTLEEIACEMLSNGHACGFRLMGMSNTPTNCPKHPARFTAVIQTARRMQFTAAGTSPADAVINALCQEKISRQPWG